MPPDAPDKVASLALGFQGSEGGDMLQEHFAAVEQSLLANSRIAANSGHTLHRGTPREMFVREFLSKHISEAVAIGTGEIIDATSKPREHRNQMDAVIHRRDYPKLDFGGGITAFLAESVVATLEIKSLLTEEELTKAVKSAHKLKQLQRSIGCPFGGGVEHVFAGGWLPPAILSYVVAYDGPERMQTLHGWLGRIHSEVGIQVPSLTGKGAHERYQVANTSIDGVFVLGKGFVKFDNTPISLVSDEMRREHPDYKWETVDHPKLGVLMLFLLLTRDVNGMSITWVKTNPYIAAIELEGCQVAFDE